MLLDEYRHSTDTKDNRQECDGQQETGNDIAHDKYDDSCTDGDGCPRDVAAFQTHDFKGSLQPLENWVIRIAVFCKGHRTD